MFYTIDGTEYPCAGGEVAIKDFYGRLRSGAFAKTSALSTGDCFALWEKYLKDGIDILHLAFSSAISASYSNAFLAAREYGNKYPERKIHVIDTQAASLGCGLFVHLARKRQLAGDSLQQTFDWCEANKLRIRHWFTVDDLFFLRRGGRVSGTAATMGTLLSIKPVMDVDVKGALAIRGKVKGRKKSIKELFKNMEANGYDADGESAIFISHGDCIDDVTYLCKLIQDRYNKKPEHIDMIGPLIGSHSGPGTVALFFVGSARE
jgi:DegV family protein with EDD domain